MSLLLIVILIVALVAGVLLLLAASKPKTFEIKRSTTINAPAAKIFPLIDDFHQWTRWSPWETLDADLLRTYAGSERGRGATYAWEGKKAGSGSMQITDSREPDLVVIRLDFTKPMAATNTTEFTLTDQDGATKVEWVMYGPASLAHRVMTSFFSMDRMVGGQFEQGLAKLKVVAEGQGGA